MPLDPKSAVRVRLRELEMTQAQLAAKIGTTPSILSRTLSSSMVRRDSHWPAILDALDLQAKLVPKSGKATDDQEG